MEVSDGRVMRSVFAVDAGTIFKLALQCLAQKRVERLFLPSANVETGYSKGNAQLKAIEMVGCLGCHFKVLGCK